jgi:hypothetical protein
LFLADDHSGPNWIHSWTDSDEPHPIFKLATDTSTPVHYWNNKQLIFTSDGNVLPDEVTERLSTLLWVIIEDAFKFSEAARQNDGGKSIPAEESLYDFIKREAATRLSDPKERDILAQMSEMFGAYVGEPAWKQSLRFAWMEECCGGGALSFSGTTRRTANTNKRGDVRRVQLLEDSPALCSAGPCWGEHPPQHICYPRLSACNSRR